jgi:hypothetical protein
MIRFNRAIKAGIIAIAALSLTSNLMAGTVTIRIDASHSGAPTTEVLNSEDYNFYVGPDVNNAAIEYGALVDLLGVDNVYGWPGAQIADRDWRFTDPKAPDPAAAAVFIIWIDHDYGDPVNGYYGPLFSGDLRVGFNQHKPGGYYRTTANAVPIQSDWVTLYSDSTLVLQFKGFKPNGGQK